jgi:DNA-binding NtrC family response regulator
MEQSAKGLNCREGEGNALADQPRKTAAPRIVIVNDEPSPLKAIALVIGWWFKDVTVLTLSNAYDALEELSLTDPDLLITDDRMPGMNGEGLCRRLLDRKVKYPIIVDSPWAPTEEWVRELALRGLNVSFLALPFCYSDLKRLIEDGLKLEIQREQAQRSTETGAQSVQIQEGGLEPSLTKSSHSEQQ